LDSIHHLLIPHLQTLPTDIHNMKSPSRKYIDLIFRASSKWANWDPPVEIKVGDYGTIDVETGKFEKEGNIYEEPTTAELVAPHPPQVDSPEKELIVTSRGVKSHEFTLEPQSTTVGLHEASIKGRWEFGSKRGALLIIAAPRKAYIPPDVILDKLAAVPLLKEKALVTGVVTCPAYSLYLSASNKEIIDVAFAGTLPVHPEVTAGGAVEAVWWTQNIAGVHRHACDKSGSYSYTPLYTLQTVRKKGILRRDSPVPDPEGDDLWVVAQEPWDPLDNDGVEEPFEDTVFD